MMMILKICNMIIKIIIIYHLISNLMKLNKENKIMIIRIIHQKLMNFKILVHLNKKLLFHHNKMIKLLN